MIQDINAPRNTAAPTARGRLAGKIAVVTGAASGIGRETALLFVREGASVLAVDIAAEALQSTADEAARLKSDGAGTLAPLALDLTHADAGTSLFAYCRERLGVPEVLANIAGRGGDGPVHRTRDEDIDHFYDLNLKTTFRLSRAALEALGARGGSIVNTASAVAMVGMTGMAPYSAAKAAVVGLTRQMAADYGRRGVRVNAVAPGLIETPATAARIRAHAFDNAVTRSRPLARVGVPLDIANAFLFFASDESSFITGAVLPVCGGWSTTRFREADEGASA